MPIVVFDNFNRANNPTVLGTANTGQVWSQVSGNWGIDTNTALVTWDNLDPLTSIAVVESGLVNAVTSVVLPSVDVPNFAAGIGLIFRYVDPNYYWRLMTFDFPGPPQPGALRLQVVYSGVVTTVIDVVGPTLVDGDKISVTCCGPLFEIFINDVSVGTYDDTPNPQNYGTQCGIISISGTFFALYTERFEDFTVTTNDACGSPSPSASPSITPSASPSASGSASPSPGVPCTPPEGSAISCINSKGRLFVTLQNVDNDQIAYAWHEGAERMPITSMTNWKRSLRALTLQELNIAFETDNAGVNDPLIVSIHRNLRKNYARDGRTTNGSNRIDSAGFGFDADNIGDMIAICGENVGGPGIDYLIGRIAAQASPSLSPSPSASISASPSTTESASPSLSPSASPSSSRSSSASPSHSPSASPSASPSLSPSPSASPSASPSSTPSASPSSSISASPSAS